MPPLPTALADLEVEHDAHDGHLYHISYPLAEGERPPHRGHHPARNPAGRHRGGGQPRRRALSGIPRRPPCGLPVLGREIPVIADAYVDMEFGTGALKITPAHDFNDFEVARRHNLPVIQVIDEGGKMNEEAGPKYVGMDRFVCREQIVKDLKRLGLLDKVEPYVSAGGPLLPLQDRRRALVSKQWFVTVKPLAEPAMAAVQDGRTRIIPANWDKSYFDWMNNIRDWCISRQIWWGHRIPAWYCEHCGEVIVSREDPAALPAMRRRRTGPGNRRPGHLVLLGPLALLHAGLAG